MLMSSTRTDKLNEPFSVSHLCPRLDNITPLVAYTTCERQVTDEQWDKLISRMNNTDSCTKIHSMDLITSKRGRSWYQHVVENNTHDIFVVVRDRLTLSLSYLIARNFGWTRYDEREPFEFEVTESMIMELALQFDHFFRFWPNNAKVITAETRPLDYFESELSNWPKQNSDQKYKYIKNYQWCKSRLWDVFDYYDEEWRSRVGYLVA